MMYFLEKNFYFFINYIKIITFCTKVQPAMIHWTCKKSGKGMDKEKEKSVISKLEWGKLNKFKKGTVEGNDENIEKEVYAQNAKELCRFFYSFIS